MDRARLDTIGSLLPTEQNAIQHLSDDLDATNGEILAAWRRLGAVGGQGDRLRRPVAAHRHPPDLRSRGREISAACREQSIGIEQINPSITQLDQVTQSNAGAASEMSETANRLSVEAARLNERAGYFHGAQPLAQSAAPSRQESVPRLQEKVQAFGARHAVKPGPARLPRLRGRGPRQGSISISILGAMAISTG